MTVTAAQKGATQTDHRLRSAPETVHWGFFDAALEPVQSSMKRWPGFWRRLHP